MVRGQHQLHYHAEKHRSAVPWRKWAAWASLIILLGTIGLFGLKIYPRVRLLWYQQHCLLYQGNPNEAIFDSRPSAMAAMQRSGIGWYNGVYKFTDRIDGTPRDVPYVLYVPREIVRFYPILSGSPVAFMHARVSPRGHQRLVIVTVEAGRGLDVLVVRPATLSEPPKFIPDNGGSRVAAGMQYVSELNVAVFNGQFDRDHGDHFTIPYKVGDKRFNVDGWLCDDDTVHMVDSGVTPASAPSPASSR